MINLCTGGFGKTTLFSGKHEQCLVSFVSFQYDDDPISDLLLGGVQIGYWLHISALKYHLFYLFDWLGAWWL